MTTFEAWVIPLFANVLEKVTSKLGTYTTISHCLLDSVRRFSGFT